MHSPAVLAGSPTPTGTVVVGNTAFHTPGAVTDANAATVRTDQQQSPSTALRGRWVDVSFPARDHKMLKWVVTHRATRRRIDPSLEHGQRGASALLMAALKAFGVREVGDDAYELSDDAAHNRFVRERNILNAQWAAKLESMQGLHHQQLELTAN
eukprot:484587-Prymnesium_polylepis.1